MNTQHLVFHLNTPVFPPYKNLVLLSKILIRKTNPIHSHSNFYSSTIKQSHINGTNNSHTNYSNISNRNYYIPTDRPYHFTLNTIVSKQFVINSIQPRFHKIFLILKSLNPSRSNIKLLPYIQYNISKNS